MTIAAGYACPGAEQLSRIYCSPGMDFSLPGGIQLLPRSVKSDDAPRRGEFESEKLDEDQLHLTVNLAVCSMSESRQQRRRDNTGVIHSKVDRYTVKEIIRAIIPSVKPVITPQEEGSKGKSPKSVLIVPQLPKNHFLENLG